MKLVIKKKQYVTQFAQLKCFHKNNSFRLPLYNYFQEDEIQFLKNFTRPDIHTHTHTHCTHVALYAAGPISGMFPDFTVLSCSSWSIQEEFNFRKKDTLTREVNVSLKKKIETSVYHTLPLVFKEIGRWKRVEIFSLPMKLRCGYKPLESGGSRGKGGP